MAKHNQQKSKQLTIDQRQKVLITGGSSGIGLELARRFTQENFIVIIADRKIEKLNNAKKDIKTIHTFQCDVTKDSDVSKMAEKIQKIFGGIDILINNAGVMNMLDIGNEKYELNKKFEDIEINYLAPIRMLHYFLPQLKKSKNATLINVSSALAYVPLTRAPIYSSTKSALHHWTLAIRPQLKIYGIKVVELVPPLVDTKLAERVGLTKGKLKPMPVKKLVDIFWKEYSRGKLEITPGVSIIFKFMSRMAPNLFYNLLNRNRALPDLHTGTTK